MLKVSCKGSWCPSYIKDFTGHVKLHRLVKACLDTIFYVLGMEFNERVNICFDIEWTEANGAGYY